MDLIKIAAIQTSLLDWYQNSARVLPWRDLPSPYRVWVSEIMLQQTRVEAVKPYFERFMESVPTVQALAELPDEQLMKLWEGLGYYSRARNLKKAACMIVEEFNGVVPGDIALLKKLPGIGPYTSGAVASIAYGVRVPAVDGNVLRVISRILASYEDISDATVKKRIEDVVYELLPYQQVGAFNQSLMELGATICLPNGAPKCMRCPVATECEANKLGVTEAIPVKGGKKARRVEQRTVLVITSDESMAIRQRPEKGLLAGLWELPNLEGSLSQVQVKGLMEEWGISVASITPWKQAKHIFTHIEWHMSSYRIEVEKLNGYESLVMASKQEVEERFSIPAAFKAFINREQ